MSCPEITVDDPKLGTTIMACVFNGGVILGADSRTSSGSWVANRVSEKLTSVADRIFVCRSGSAADTQAVTEAARMNISLYSLDANEPCEVSVAANILNNMLYNYKDNLLAGMIVAGIDPKNGAKVYSLPVGGGIFEQNWTIGGSGSSYIYGFCDSNYRENMSQEEAVDFVLRAVSLAISRDGSSGGVCRMVIVTQDNVERRMYTPDKLPFA